MMMPRKKCPVLKRCGTLCWIHSTGKAMKQEEIQGKGFVYKVEYKNKK